MTVTTQLKSPKDPEKKNQVRTNDSTEQRLSVKLSLMLAVCIRYK